MKFISAPFFALLLMLSAPHHFCSAQTPVMSWDFESIRNRNAIEATTSLSDTIEGNYEVPVGVSGKGLRLDGFTPRVLRNK